MITFNRVLVQLDKFDEQIDGITIPLYERGTTDGGQPTAVISNQKFLSKGTVIEVSPSANTQLEADNITLKPGDRVFVSQTAMSSTFQYFPKRNNLVIDFEGYMLLPVNLIENINPDETI